MKPALFSPRSFFLGSLTVIVTLTVIGWGMWSLAAAQYRHIIDHWIDEGRSSGYQISYDDRQVFGFPRRITMRFENLHWKNTDGIDFHTDDMDIVATPWDWDNFDAKFKNHVAVAAPVDSEGRALVLSAGAGHAHVRLDDGGAWREAKLVLEDSDIGLSPSYLFHADALSASVARPDEAPKDHTEPGLSLQGEADDVTLPASMPTPFGNKAKKFSTHMRVMGRVPDIRKRDSVAAWNAESGIVEFDDFDLSWGVLDLESKGTLGFDDDLQPEGAFAGNVGSPEDTMKALVDHGFIELHDTSMLLSAMKLFAKPSANGSKGMELPITVQLGGLFFGPIRLFMFPQIEWPSSPPPVPAS